MQGNSTEVTMGKIVFFLTNHRIVVTLQTRFNIQSSWSWIHCFLSQWIFLENFLVFFVLILLTLRLPGFLGGKHLVSFLPLCFPMLAYVGSMAMK